MAVVSQSRRHFPNSFSCMKIVTFWCKFRWILFTKDQLTTMTSSNGKDLRVTCPWCGEFTGDRWIPLTKASDAELWCFFDLRLEWTVEYTIVRLVIWDVIALIMTPLKWKTQHWFRSIMAWWQLPVWRQAIIWTSGGLVWWRICKSLLTLNTLVMTDVLNVSSVDEGRR